MSGSGTICISTLPASVSRTRLGASKRQWPDSKCSGPSEVALPAVLAAADVQDTTSTLPSCSRGSLLLEAGVLLGRLWPSCTHSENSQLSLELLSLWRVKQALQPYWEVSDDDDDDDLLLKRSAPCHQLQQSGAEEQLWVHCCEL